MNDDPVVTMMLPGAPRGKGRPRFRIIKPKGRPQFVSVYTDAETAEYEASLAAVGREAMGSMAPLDEALRCLSRSLCPSQLPGRRRRRRPRGGAT